MAQDGPRGRQRDDVDWAKLISAPVRVDEISEASRVPLTAIIDYAEAFLFALNIDRCEEVPGLAFLGSREAGLSHRSDLAIALDEPLEAMRRIWSFGNGLASYVPAPG